MSSLVFNPQDTRGTRKKAEGLVSRGLLQDDGSGGYRGHDLVLEFAKIKIRAAAKVVQKSAALQAQYLGKLDVVAGYESPEQIAGSPDFSVLAALWRSVEELLGDPGLEVASYRASLGELESGEATAGVARAYSSVASLFNLQVLQGLPTGRGHFALCDVGERALEASCLCRTHVCNNSFICTRLDILFGYR